MTPGVDDVVLALWFLLPAGVANTAPVLVRGVPVLARPVDGGHTWRGQPLLGRNKTWRGLVAAPLAGLLVFALERKVEGAVPWLHEHSLLGAGPLWWGAVLGAGAIVGDLVKSFGKRRVAVAPGRSWFPCDQLDWAVGAIAAIAPWHFLGWAAAAGVIAVGLGLHLAAGAVGHLVGLRERWI